MVCYIILEKERLLISRVDKKYWGEKAPWKLKDQQKSVSISSSCSRLHGPRWRRDFLQRTLHSYFYIFLETAFKWRVRVSRKFFSSPNDDGRYSLLRLQFLAPPTSNWTPGPMEYRSIPSGLVQLLDFKKVIYVTKFYMQWLAN